YRAPQRLGFRLLYDVAAFVQHFVHYVRAHDLPAVGDGRRRRHHLDGRGADPLAETHVGPSEEPGTGRRNKSERLSRKVEPGPLTKPESRDITMKRLAADAFGQHGENRVTRVVDGLHERLMSVSSRAPATDPPAADL